MFRVQKTTESFQFPLNSSLHLRHSVQHRPPEWYYRYATEFPDMDIV
jgi:hypothetical protein